MDLRIVARAKDYMDALAQGIDPLSGAVIPEGEVVRQERLVKCFCFVSEVLQSFLETDSQQHSFSANYAKDKIPFDLRRIDLSRISISQEPVGITRLIGRINDLCPDNMEKLKRTGIVNWLVENSYLQQVQMNGKMHVRSGPRAAEIGIIEAEQTNPEGNTYTAVLYNENAQRFVLSKLAVILSEKGNPSSRKHPNKGRPWTKEDDAILCSMLETGTAISAIATELGRTQRAIEMRLEKLELNTHAEEEYKK